MALFLTNSRLSENDLRLSLTNEFGYASDAYSVRYTVFSDSGVQISGKSLPAIRKSTGVYYAPLTTLGVKNSNYHIEWEIIDVFGQYPKKFIKQFFILDPSSYLHGSPLTKNNIPERGKFTYLSGSYLSKGDLPLFLTSQDGFFVDAFAVFWMIKDISGYLIHPKTFACHCGPGEYYAEWRVCVPSGDYIITWEWMECPDSSLKSNSMGFSVIDPVIPYIPIAPVLCERLLHDKCNDNKMIFYPRVLTMCSDNDRVNHHDHDFIKNNSSCSGCNIMLPPVYTNSCCFGAEVPRTIHLPTQVLPVSGIETDQPPYKIPHGIKKIAFYISYTRGAAGGYAGFRLLWGNGVEETQESLVDVDINKESSSNSSQSISLLDLCGPTPIDDNKINFIFYVTAPGGSSTVRLVACEKGVTGSPGTIGIVLTASVD
jgi:hypothetical protein